MSFDRARRILELATKGLQALEVIGNVTKGVVPEAPRETAMDALRVIEGVVKTIQAGLDGAITVEAVEDSLRDLRAEVKANDDAVASAVDAKFG